MSSSFEDSRDVKRRKRLEQKKIREIIGPTLVAYAGSYWC